MPWGDFKDLSRRTASDKVLHDKAFNVTKNQNMMDIKRELTSMVDRFFDKHSASASIHTWTGINFENQQVAEELHKHIKKFKKPINYIHLLIRITCGVHVYHIFN